MMRKIGAVCSLACVSLIGGKSVKGDRFDQIRAYLQYVRPRYADAGTLSFAAADNLDAEIRDGRFSSTMTGRAERLGKASTGYHE